MKQFIFFCSAVQQQIGVSNEDLERNHTCIEEQIGYTHFYSEFTFLHGKYSRLSKEHYIRESGVTHMLLGV